MSLVGFVALFCFIFVEFVVLLSWKAYFKDFEGLFFGEGGGFDNKGELASQVISLECMMEHVS